MRWLGILPAAAVAFLCGSRLADGAPPKPDKLVRELDKRQKMIFKDLRRIEQAVKDILELRETRAAGKFVLNDEEKKLEKSARVDFHIFMERFRNDTLETLQILDRVLQKEDYVDPIRRVFGKALDEVVEVDWDEIALDEIVEELVHGYGVKMFVRGEIDQRKTMSLQGQMSLLGILLHLENVFDAVLVLRDGHLWFERIKAEKTPKTDDEE